MHKQNAVLQANSISLITNAAPWNWNVIDDRISDETNSKFTENHQWM